MGLLLTDMINFLLRHGNAEVEATSIYLLALSEASLARRFRSREAFLNNSRKTTYKCLAAYPITFSNNDSIVGLRLQAYACAPAWDGQISNPSMRPSC